MQPEHDEPDFQRRDDQADDQEHDHGDVAKISELVEEIDPKALELNAKRRSVHVVFPVL